MLEQKKIWVESKGSLWERYLERARESSGHIRFLDSAVLICPCGTINCTFIRIIITWFFFVFFFTESQSHISGGSKYDKWELLRSICHAQLCAYWEWLKNRWIWFIPLSCKCIKQIHNCACSPPPTIQLHLDCFNGKYVQRPVTEHLFSLEQMEMSVAVARNKNITSKTSEMKSLLHQLAI